MTIIQTRFESYLQDLLQTISREFADDFPWTSGWSACPLTHLPFTNRQDAGRVTQLSKYEKSHNLR